MIDERERPALEPHQLGSGIEHAVEDAAPFHRGRQPLGRLDGRLGTLQRLLGLGELGARHVPACREGLEL